MNGAASLTIAGLLGCGSFAVGALPTRPSYRADPTYLIDTWETEDGLPGNSATAIVQTPDGYLWFGTFDGLVRFDGVKFTVLNPANTPQMPSAGVVNLHLDRSGRLWVSTYRGLGRLDGARWQAFGTNEGWYGDLARTFAERPNGDLLVTTFDGRVMEYSGGRFTQLPSPPGRMGTGYLGIADAAGRWCVVQQWFVGSWDGTNWMPAASVSNLFSKINGGGETRDGGLWLLSGRELWKYRPGSEATHTMLAEWPGNPWSITEDTQGNVWIAAYDQGVSCVSPSGEMRRWTTTNGLSYNGTRCVFEDREHNFWVGTSGGGLQRFTPRRAHGFGVESGLSDRNVTSVQPDGAGGVWLATYAKGMFRWRDGKVSPVALPPGHNTLNVVNSVLTDRAGRTWFGTWGQSVCVVDTNGFRRIPHEQTGGFNILSLFEDSGGRIWAGGEREISVGDGGVFRRVARESDASLAGVRCGAEDRDGVLWASNLEGLFRLEKNQFAEVRADGASVRDITCIKADVDGAVWLGSLNGGLLGWRAGRFTRITLAAGPPEPGVHGILEDDAGFFWMASNRGILRVARKDLLAVADGRAGPVECRVIDLSDGLPSVECAGSRQPICARDDRGRLWFATLKGAAMIEPEKFSINEKAPLVHIEEVSYFRAAPGGEVRLRTPFAETISLPPGSRRLELHYTGINLAAAEKVHYRVMLEGMDTDWQDAGSRRSAYYHDLPPRGYIFRVRAANSDGVWNKTEASLAFVVRPFIWQTGWFRVAGALVFMGSGGGAVWMWARARLRHAAEREKTAREIRDLAGRLITAQEEERTRLARELHDDLSQSLALLSVDLELFGQKPPSAPDQINTRMQELSSQVKGLSSEVHRLSHELHPAKLEQLGLAAAVRGFCKELSAAHQLAVRFEAGDVPRALPDDVALCLYRVTQEALQNVVKHSGAASARVALVSTGNEIRLSILDDGDGFDPAQVQGHASLGLVSMHERVRLVQGHLSVKSKPGEGTRVEVRVSLAPLK